MFKFEVTYEWAGSTGSVYMSTDIVKAKDETDARKRFLERHDGIRHKIMDVRKMA